MKTTVIVSVLACAAGLASASAVPRDETNAARLARGLPPKPPVRRGTRTSSGQSGTPSNTPPQCNTGPIQCCNQVTKASSGPASLIARLLGLVLDGDLLVGLTCSPLSVIGIGGNSCSSQPVCCQNNSFNGLIAIGCSPININL
ncbi:hypothetical protein NP233_g942 [Leucocoprinus birnbaumii]|uniref:Hydrophobin n=1 Tax=Leucocoprinus birnbaumii TaxID=56174 RepID=A0AAD5YWB3_9AGAR|nr:hypothetical protein NP233_g942 [Leucocoprinus birnbaumii]